MQVSRPLPQSGSAMTQMFHRHLPVRNFVLRLVILGAAISLAPQVFTGQTCSSGSDLDAATKAAIEWRRETVSGYVQERRCGWNQGQLYSADHRRFQCHRAGRSDQQALSSGEEAFDNWGDVPAGSLSRKPRRRCRAPSFTAVFTIRPLGNRTASRKSRTQAWPEERPCIARPEMLHCNNSVFS